MILLTITGRIESRETRAGVRTIKLLEGSYKRSDNGKHPPRLVKYFSGAFYYIVKTLETITRPTQFPIICLREILMSL